MGGLFKKPESYSSKYSSERAVILVSVLEIFECKMRAFGQVKYKVALL